MLNIDPSLLDFAESLGVWTKQIKLLDGSRMHGRDIEKTDIRVHSRFGIDITALAYFLSTICTLAPLEFVSGEHLRQIRVDELILRMLVATEYDPCGMLVRGVVNRQTRNRSKDLPSRPVTRKMVEHCLSGNNVVVAILGDFLPPILRDRLIPWHTELLVMDPEFDLPLLQALLVASRREVVHIGVGYVVRFTKERVSILADDPLAELVQFLVRVTQISGIEDVVVVPTAVETDQLHAHELLDLLRGRVDHSDNLIPISLELPVHQEQIREHLDIEEHDSLVVVVRVALTLILGLEVHLVHEVYTICRLVSAVVGEREHIGEHIADIINHAGLVGIVKNLLDEVHTGLRARMDLLSKIPDNKTPQPPLGLHVSAIYHFLSFQRQPTGNMSDGKIVTLRQPPSQATLPTEHLDLDSERI